LLVLTYLEAGAFYDSCPA